MVTVTQAYSPELGQAAFGNEWHEYEVPSYVEAALLLIDHELSRVMHNCGMSDDGNPFDNSGNVEGFVTGVFEVHAYDWGAEDREDGQPFNFKWGDWCLSWYKWCGRGMSMSRELPADECAKMLDECMACLRAFEDEHDDGPF